MVQVSGFNEDLLNPQYDGPTLILYLEPHSASLKPCGGQPSPNDLCGFQVSIGIYYVFFES